MKATFAIPERFAGALILGDLHGQRTWFEQHLKLAEARNLFVLCLGDLIDRGPDSVGCLRLVRDGIHAERLAFVPGNHDDKLYRTLINNPTQLTGGLRQTLAELEAAPDRSELIEWYTTLFADLPLCRRLPRAALVHAAYDPAMDALSVSDRRSSWRGRALYGQQSKEQTADGRQSRVYDWVENLPAGLQVYLGHDPMSIERLLLRGNANGACVWHLDGGAGHAAENGRLLGLETDRDGLARALFAVNDTGLTPVPHDNFARIAA